MKIIRSEVLGFCMGVRRAVELAAAEADRHAAPVYTLGPLIHNPAVLADLESRGVKVLDVLPQSIEGCVIIRAHGIGADVEEKLRSAEMRSAGRRVVDATCPRVKASQIKAEELAFLGYCLFLAGTPEHAEIEGIVGYTKSAPFRVVVSGPLDAEREALRLYRKNNDAKTALLGQTTISEDEYLKIGEAIKICFPNLEIVNTICPATAERQQALRDLLNRVDAVIIAGGKESANTRRLLTIAEESGKPCALVENTREIPVSFRSFETVGLCAGASSPDSLITEIEEALLKL
jgi:4-hydroxy-3-methylbut-2-enyl diphosphate reductase